MMMTIIESMKEKAVHIEIITEDHLLPLKEEEEKEAIRDITTSITDQEIITSRNTMRMNTDIVEETRIIGRAAIITNASILALSLLQDHVRDLLNSIKSIITRTGEKR